MGYHTRYELEVKYCCPDCRQLTKCRKSTQQQIRKEKIFDGQHYDETTYDAVMRNDALDWKWYEHETSVSKLSKNYPDILFILSGEGENSRDVWKKYFLNGKVQVAKAQIVIADFDPTQLE